jgi:hypothetical protein
MNKKELIMQRKKTHNKYGVWGGSYHSRRAKNAVYFHRNPNGVSDEHEVAKFMECLRLKREGKEFITEAWRRGTRPPVIRDIVCLDNEEIIEVETDPKRAARFKDDPDSDKIRVLKLWEK